MSRLSDLLLFLVSLFSCLVSVCLSLFPRYDQFRSLFERPISTPVEVAFAGAGSAGGGRGGGGAAGAKKERAERAGRRGELTGEMRGACMDGAAAVVHAEGSGAAEEGAAEEGSKAEGGGTAAATAAAAATTTTMTTATAAAAAAAAAATPFEQAKCFARARAFVLHSLLQVTASN